MKSWLQALKKEKKFLIALLFIILVAGLGFGIYKGINYFDKNFSIVRKSKLENLIMESEMADKNLKNANGHIKERNEYIQSLLSVIDAKDSVIQNRPVITKTIYQPVPVNNNSGVEDAIRDLTRCLGTKFPEIWCW
jgi:hypothetical protein